MGKFLFRKVTFEVLYGVYSHEEEEKTWKGLELMVTKNRPDTTPGGLIRGVKTCEVK